MFWLSFFLFWCFVTCSIISLLLSKNMDLYELSFVNSGMILLKKKCLFLIVTLKSTFIYRNNQSLEKRYLVPTDKRNDFLFSLAFFGSLGEKAAILKLYCIYNDRLLNTCAKKKLHLNYTATFSSFKLVLIQVLRGHNSACCLCHITRFPFISRLICLTFKIFIRDQHVSTYS